MRYRARLKTIDRAGNIAELRAEQEAASADEIAELCKAIAREHTPEAVIIGMSIWPARQWKEPAKNKKTKGAGK